MPSTLLLINSRFGALCSSLGRNRARNGSPDLRGVLVDGTVTRKLTNGGYVLDGHLQPLGSVLVYLRNTLLALDVRLVIGQKAIPR